MIAICIWLIVPVLLGKPVAGERQKAERCIYMDLSDGAGERMGSPFCNCKMGDCKAVDTAEALRLMAGAACGADGICSGAWYQKEAFFNAGLEKGKSKSDSGDAWVDFAVYACDGVWREQTKKSIQLRRH